MTTKSHCQLILEWLQSGKSITALEALFEFGCFRLGARIKDLRSRGHHIITEPYAYTNSAGEKKTIAKYHLAKTEKQGVFDMFKS